MRQGKRGAISVLAALALLGLTPVIALARPDYEGSLKCSSCHDMIGYADTVSLKLVGGGPDYTSIVIAAGIGIAAAVLGLAYWKGRRARGPHPA